MNGLSRCVRCKFEETEEENKEEGSDGAEESPSPSLINEFSYLYFSPETILYQGRQNTTASDVWSLGVLFYALACGRLPFSGIHEIINDPVSWSFARNRRIELSAPFVQLVTAMLSKEPENRPSIEQIKTNDWVKKADSAPLAAD